MLLGELRCRDTAKLQPADLLAAEVPQRHRGIQG